MKLADREKNWAQALLGTSKSALSLAPVIGQIFAGYDAYKKSQFDRSVLKLIGHLQDRVDNLELFFENPWIKTEEGEQFVRKVVDAACDAQLEDKQELFANALVSGITDQQTTTLEKLKFTDILRHLSRASLMVLSEMHKRFENQTRRPGQKSDPVSAYPLVDPESIAESLSHLFHPYLVAASINEMTSHGLFNNTGEWKEQSNGKYSKGGGFQTALCYTDFTARFVEFVIDRKAQSGQIGDNQDEPK